MAAPSHTEALVLLEPNQPLQRETIVLEKLKSDEALVQIKAFGICHTDIGCMEGKIPVPLPHILGHEGAGIIVEVGDAIQDQFSAGDKVILSFNSCGQCRNCGKDSPSYCEHFFAFNFGSATNSGQSRIVKSTKDASSDIFASFFGQSSFTQYAVVQAASLVKVGLEEDLSLLAPLGCSVQTGAGCVINTLGVEKGTSIAIFGVGAVGMSALMAAAAAGASTIIAVDLTESRLELAKELGATHTLNPQKGDIVSQIRAITLSLDYGVDTTGVHSVVSSMVEALGSRGSAVTVGSPGPEDRVSITAVSFVLAGKRLSGSIEGDSIPGKMLPFLVSEHSKGRLPIEKMIKKYSVDSIDQAIQDMKSGVTIKPVILWD